MRSNFQCSIPMVIYWVGTLYIYIHVYIRIYMHDYIYIYVNVNISIQPFTKPYGDHLWLLQNPEHELSQQKSQPKKSPTFTLNFESLPPYYSFTLGVRDQPKWLVFGMIHVKVSLLPTGKVWSAWSNTPCTTTMDS